MKIKFKDILILLLDTMEIKDYPNYLIYEDGRVYTNNKRKGFLKPNVNKKGYHILNLYCNGKQKMFSVHRLVALHYIPNPDNKPQVDHIDRNKQNNHVSNLRWVTSQENIDNRDLISNTGEKYISYQKHRHRYDIRVKGNRIILKCKNHTLQDAINVRDALLG